MDTDAMELQEIIDEERERHGITPDGKRILEYPPGMKSELQAERRWRVAKERP